MTVYAGDSAPDAITLEIATGQLDGTTVASVKCRVRTPSGQLREWGPMAPTSTTTSKVTCVRVLEADGSSVPDPGTYHLRASLYDAGGVRLKTTNVSPLKVEPTSIQAPT